MAESWLPYGAVLEPAWSASRATVKGKRENPVSVRMSRTLLSRTYYGAREVVAISLYDLQQRYGTDWPHRAPEATIDGIARVTGIKRDTVDNAISTSPSRGASSWFQKVIDGKPSYHGLTPTGKAQVEKIFRDKRFSFEGEGNLSLPDINNRLLPRDPESTVAKVALSISTAGTYTKIAADGRHAKATRQRAAEDQHLPPGDLLEALRQLGIEDATAQLSRSGLEPTECMQKARNSLSFMGIFGSKWVQLPPIRARFREFLANVEERSGHVRFLLMDPASAAFKKLERQREGGISAEALEHFSRLADEFPCLSVRLYQHLPHFRLVFLDEEIAAVARYRNDKEGYNAGEFGWRAPHLVIRRSPPWSLYEAFRLYYEDAWDQALPVGSGVRRP